MHLGTTISDSPNPLQLETLWSVYQHHKSSASCLLTSSIIIMSTKLSIAVEPAAESFLSRTIFAPILFISFLISLVIVDRTTSAKVFRHGNRRNGSPNSSRPSSSQSNKSTQERGKEDYYRSHQKKLMRSEANDAFAMRHKVIAAMMVCLALGLMVLAWSGVKVWGFLVPLLRSSGSSLVAG